MANQPPSEGFPTESKYKPIDKLRSQIVQNFGGMQGCQVVELGDMGLSDLTYFGETAVLLNNNTLMVVAGYDDFAALKGDKDNDVLKGIAWSADELYAMNRGMQLVLVGQYPEAKDAIGVGNFMGKITSIFNFVRRKETMSNIIYLGENVGHIETFAEHRLDGKVIFLREPVSPQTVANSLESLGFRFGVSQETQES